MKALISLLILTTLGFSEKPFNKNPNKDIKDFILPTFYSKGMLPENYTFVCIDGEKYLQYKDTNHLILERQVYTDDMTGKEVAYECL